MTEPASHPREQGADVAAARWYDRLHAHPTSADIAAFEAWRATKPDNAKAYAEIEQSATLVRDLKDMPALLVLRNETLNRVAANRSVRGGRWAIAAGIAATLAIGGFWGLAQTSGLFGGSSAPQIAAADIQTYRTRLGERMSVTLADGSVVHLNTQSIVQVGYTKTERRLTLVGGQALFEVAKAPQRPFIVTAQNRTVTALGTQFDVRLDQSRLQIALVEGTVIVRNSPSPNAAATKLKPNDVMRFAGNQVSLTHFSSLRSLISWKDGLILFESTPLTEAVEELNRYTPHPILIGDAKAGAIKVSGSFPTGKTANFLEAVQLLFPVKAMKDKDDNIVLRYAG